jgi:L,D-transpeptidase YcbB
VPSVRSFAANAARVVLAPVFVAAALGPCADLVAQPRADIVATTLISAAHPWLREGGHFTDVQRLVRDLRAADSTAVFHWSTSTGAPTAAARTLLTYVAADQETSRAERADVAILDSIAKKPLAMSDNSADRALFDIGLDIVMLRHAFVHRQGRIDPTRVHAEWSMAPAELDVAALTAALTGGCSPSEVFAALEPQTRAYQLLVKGLANARAEDADTTEQLPVAPPRAINAGASYASAPALARVLVRLGELPARFDVASVRTSYSKPLSDAIARWKGRKLKKGRVTGSLDADVLAKLLDEYENRGDRIAMAIERWRWLPRSFSNDPLVVNLPEYRLHTYSQFRGDSADRLSMNVVIGRADSNATPVFAANMTQVVFSPQWHVPTSIMLKEILPAATANAGYLSRHNYELTTSGGRAIPNTAQNIARIGTGVMVRQRSGDDNSLGKVKFLLPNPYDIYLHDTPSRSLFSRVRRDFSHGCVRLGDPMAMARYVLGSQPVWTDAKITEAMNAGVERYVRVPRPIPVLIVYQTAVVEPDGSLRYFNDVYGHDAILADALERAR